MISIILPIYNMQNYIAECLESIVAQTYKDIEIICVNDFSMDNSMTIVKEYAEKDSRIKIVNNGKNRGLGGARNAGLDIAKGEYVMFCDTDDMLMPTMVEKLYNSLVENDADMAFCDVMLLDNDGGLNPYKPFHIAEINTKKEFYPSKAIWEFSDIWPSAWNKIYKKSIIDEFGIKYHENILYEDHTFYWEYLFKCNKVIHINEPLYCYRHNRYDSIMKEVSPRIFEIFTILDYIKEIFKNNMDFYWYSILMPKIATRLIWERTCNFKKNTKVKNEFNNKGYKYLSQFKRKNIFKHKDRFIGDDAAFLYSPCIRFLLKVFSIRKRADTDVIYFFGVKIIRKNKIRELQTRIDNIEHTINCLKESINYVNK